ncbi:MAG: amino acid adenylation domain-containing protein [Acidobacteriota bacterium]
MSAAGRDDTLVSDQPEVEQGSTAAGKSRLSSAQRDLLRRRLARNRAGIPRRQDRSPVELSLAQERLWFFERLDPGTALYNITRLLPLAGALDGAALERALAAVVDRHEALRTAFVEVDGEPRQAIAEAVEVVIEVDEVSPEEVDALAAAEARRPFDLASPPLLRARLLRLGTEDHRLLLTVHHLVVDGWSFGLLLRELGALYEAYSQGREVDLPELSAQYGDFALWERRQLDGQALAPSLDHWRRRLAGSSPEVSLPLDRQRPAESSLAGARLAFTLDDALSRALRWLAQQHEVSLFTVLLTAWGALLERYGGHSDVVVGSPVANRGRAELEGLIGFFVNTLPLRIDLGGRPSVAAALERSQRSILEDFEHQQVPFARLVEELAPERNGSHAPLFQTILALANVPRGSAGPLGSSIGDLVAIDKGRVEVDLMMLLDEAEDGLRGDLVYATELFDGATAARIVRHFEALLGAMVARPEAVLTELPLLEEDERRRLLLDHNRTTTTYPREGSLAQRFAEVVEQDPAAIAVSAGEDALTYGELADRAGRLAAELRRQGVGPEQRAGLYLQRSVEAVVAILAIVEAGAAYVPLDPELPEERLATMLADCRPALVIARRDDAGGSDRLADWNGPVLAIEDLESDAGGGDLAGQAVVADGGPPPEISGDSLAYVMYTSGSTGRPKGVAIPQRAVLRLVCDSRFMDLGPEVVFLLQATLAFDASTLELWGPLLNGGRLVIMPAGVHSLTDLGSVIADRGVNALWLTAGLFHQMVDDNLGGLTGVRQLLAGGDVLSPAHIRRVLEAHPECHVINGYGPTENTTFTTTHRVGSSAELEPSVPIGGPVSNSRVYVLDGALQPVPEGVEGDLYTAGDGLARGYWQRPAATAEVFVPDPFDDTGGRLYRTGDRAVWRPEGWLQFRGRRDGQVKMRGFRIELGEIERQLARQPEVAVAAVVARGDDAESKTLAAYLVPAAGTRLDVEALRSALRRSLPDYMVPATLTVLDELPLTANGKVDRRRLPVPTVEGSSPAVGAVTEDALEEIVAGLYGELLDLGPVPRDGDFFALGGHSLKATRLVSRLRQAFGVEVPLRALFAAPTVAALAAQVRRLLDLEAPALPPLTRAGSRSADTPLSFAQERLWFLDRLAADRAVYNLPVPLRLRGALDRAALGRALSALAERHDPLRTVFPAQGGRPYRRVLAPAAVQPTVIDLSALPAAPRDHESERVQRWRARAAFDLAAGPVFRASLIAHADDHHVALLELHHIAGDGWSLEILVRELAVLYGQETGAAEETLAPLPVTYGDFARWQRGWLAGEVLAEQTDYWRRRLAGAPPLLELPTDRPRPIQRCDQGARLPFALSEELSTGVEVLAKQLEATPFMVLLTALQVLLSRLSGQSDISIGTPVAGRRQPETEGLIGFFVNTLVLRAELAPEDSFAAAVAATRDTSLEAYGHQDLPFERLVQELSPQRSLSHAPLFQVMFALQNDAPVELSPAGMDWNIESLDVGTSKFDLMLSLVRDAAGGFRGRLEYSTELFDADTAERMARQLERLIASAVADPGQALSRLAWLDEAERRELLARGAGERPPVPAGETLLSLLSDQVHRTPLATAVIDADGRELSFRELDQRAGRLAFELRQQRVGLESVVGVCLERSADLVVALLAVLKAGGAYLPLDPDYPAERLAAMLGDASAAALILGAEVDLEPLAAANLPRLRPHQSQKDGPVWDGAGSEIPPAAAAYVLFTSGSTGRPKGVTISHRAIVNHMRWMARALPLAPDDRVLQKTPFSFDASGWELWAPLIEGATLVMAAPGAHLDPAELVAAIDEHGITVLQAVPTLWRMLLAEPTFRQSASLRRLFAGGEAFPDDLAAALRNAQPQAEIYNLYGPTEVTIDATCAAVDGSAVTLGRPIDHLHAYVLGGDLEPQPVGVPGELWLGGAGVGRGYRDRPAETAAAFRPHPFAGAPGGERLYRTGDRVRWRRDGELEYLGRLDDQVKVRGFRIEPGEVEAALEAVDGVREAAVGVRQAAAGDHRLVAWVAPAEVSPRGLRQALAAVLPDHLVPADYVTLDELPRTPSGKIDRRALPAPEADRDALGAAFVAPRNPVEEIVAGIWADVLGREQIGVEDDFFELGGHSLLATQVVARVREALGCELSLRGLFTAPTVAAMAAAVGDGDRRGFELPPLEPSTSTAPPPLSFSQERLWFLDRLLPERAAYNLPTPLRLRGPLDVALLVAAFAALAQRHEALRTALPDEAGSPVVRPLVDGEGLLRRVDLSTLPADRAEVEADRLRSEDARRPFDLARGPLFRATLLRLGGELHDLLLTMHHVASDGWSMKVLAQDLAELYSALRRDRAPRLDELRVSYGDFARWQRGWLDGALLNSQMDYWRRQLAGAPSVLDLPTDRPRPAEQSYRGDRLPVTFPEELAVAVEALARRAGASPFMVLLTALQVVLGRWARQSDISIGTPVAGRRREATESLVGFFVNTLVLRTDLGGDPSFRDALARVRDVALDAFAHQDLPFEKLVQEIDPERSLSHSPLFQVMFVVQSPEPVALEGVEIEGLEVPTGTAKFDLLIALTRHPDGFRGALEYATDLFDGATLERFVGHWRRLLTAAVEEPAQPLSRLPWLSPEERRQVVVDWNDTATAQAGEESCLHHRFASAAATFADETAVIDVDGSTVTYGDLDLRSNVLAHRLATLGVGPDVPVGICLERSAELAVAVLAVLKAGGVYLPLDPEYPEERLTFMVADSAAAVVISSAAVPDFGAAVPRLLVDDPADDPDSWGAAPPQAFADPDQLAYLIYTSGSTGRPKGVAMAHRPLANLLRWQLAASAMGRGDRTLQFASLSFDVHFQEMFSTWCSGGALVLVDEETRRDARGLATLLAEQRVRRIFVPFVALQFLAEAVEGGAPLPADLREVVTAGEQLQVNRPVAALFRRLPEATLHNHYGPSECHVVTALELTGEVNHWPALPTIGGPIDNCAMVIVDPRLEPVPVGVPGDLLIAGTALARGYLGRPALTAERFVPDPWTSGAEGGGRLYRTGDLARWLPSGEIEFLGRIDHQVKVRGFRVELGEIEARLVDHPAIAEAVVVVREDDGEARLAAYWVPRAGATPSAAELRSFLKEALPDYMIPSDWMALEALPLTPSGKIQRSALPEPDRDALASAEEGDGPRTPYEQILAGLWSELLKVESISFEDNFFDLGGHSLHATRHMHRLEELLGVAVKVRALFAAQTLEELAFLVEEAVLDELENLDPETAAAEVAAAGPVAAVEQPVLDLPEAEELAERRGELPEVLAKVLELRLRRALDRAVYGEAIPRRREDGPAPLSWSQEILWFVEQQEGTPSSIYRFSPVLGLKGALDVAAFEASFRALAQRHEILRTRFGAQADGTSYQEVLPDAGLAVRQIDLRKLPEAERVVVARRAIEGLVAVPFDLTAPPLFRVVLVRLEDQRWWYSLLIHHIVIDDWGFGVYYQELAAFYEAYSQGEEPELPELSIQYADYAVWERERLQGDLMEKLTTYWRGRFADGLPQMKFETDNPRPERPSYQGALSFEQLPSELSQALAERSRSEDVSLFMILLAGFKLMLSQASGQLDVMVASPNANRPREQTEELVGSFFNLMLMRTSLDGDPTLRQLLQRVRETALEAYSHQEFPFILVAPGYEPPEPNPGKPPIQALFSYQSGTRDGDVRLGDLEIESVPIFHHGDTDLDLLLSIREHDGDLDVILLHDIDIFEPTTAARMQAVLRGYLSAIAFEPDLRLSQLEPVISGESG